MTPPEPTILMPSPGGQATPRIKRDGTAPSTAPAASVELQRLVAGINPLLGAASTLLALAEQLRHTVAHDGPDALRAQLLEQVAQFEAAAAAGGVARPKVTAARYLLCSFIDEVIAQTPWGAGPWGANGRDRTLLQEFHEERSGADKAFQLLDRLGQDPADNADLLELFYVCLRLGFEGRFRGAPGGRAQLDALAERIIEVARPAAPSATSAPAASAARGGTRRVLSGPQAVACTGRRERALLPPWLIAVFAAAAALGIVLFLGQRLDAASRPVFVQLHALPQALRSERPAAATAAAKPRLAPRLQAQTQAGALQVRDEALRSVVMLPADALFVPGSADLEARAQAALAALAEALKDTNGQIAVIGHTDSAPTASLQFPSNWHLSHQRARAVQAALVQHGVPLARLRSEGRADIEPVSTDAYDRARNRRIEVELRLPRPEE